MGLISLMGERDMNLKKIALSPFSPFFFSYGLVKNLPFECTLEPHLFVFSVVTKICTMVCGLSMCVSLCQVG